MLTRLRLFEPVPCYGFRTAVIPGRHWNIAVTPGEKIELVGLDNLENEQVIGHAQVIATYVSEFEDVPDVTFEHHYAPLVPDRTGCSLHIQQHYKVIPQEVTVLHLIFEDLLVPEEPVKTLEPEEPVKTLVPDLENDKVVPAKTSVKAGR